MVGLVGFSVTKGSVDIFSKEGINFVIKSDWNAVEGRESYGALPYIVGTLLSAGIAMAIGVPISLAIAIFISEIAPPKIGTALSFLSELLAAVPSIIYGLWALFVFRFWVRDIVEKPLYDAFHGSLHIYRRNSIGNHDNSNNIVNMQGGYEGGSLFTERSSIQSWRYSMGNCEDGCIPLC
jgi:phosphate transport system permease protein